MNTVSTNEWSHYFKYPVFIRVNPWLNVSFQFKGHPVYFFNIGNPFASRSARYA
jgi:hypothetical protein